MKYILIIGSIVLGTLSLTNCSNNRNEISDSPAPHQIELIDGNKWIVDAEMMQWIDLIANSVTDFNGESLKEHKVLAENISKNLAALTSNCTMTGQAHDELHKWLLPFLDLSGKFDVIKTKEEGGEVVKELKKEVEIFNTYFK